MIEDQKLPWKTGRKTGISRPVSYNDFISKGQEKNKDELFGYDATAFLNSR